MKNKYLIVKKTFFWTAEGTWLEENFKDYELIAVTEHSMTNEKTYYFKLIKYANKNEK